NASNQTADDVNFHGVFITSASSNIVVEDLEVTACMAHCVFADGASDIVTVRGCYLHDSGLLTTISSRAVWGNGVTNMLIVNNTADTINGFSYTINNSSSHCRIIGNHSEAPIRFDGIIIHTSDHILIANNTINNSEDSGIVIELSNYCVIAGNIISDSEVTGINIAGCTFCTIVGNTVKDSSQRTNNTFESKKRMPTKKIMELSVMKLLTL
ncbi:hypothetical protein LCGC14_2618720, partial [marine sediment metagenome]